MPTDHLTGGFKVRPHSGDPIRMMAFTGKEPNTFIRQGMAIPCLMKVFGSLPVNAIIRIGSPL